MAANPPYLLAPGSLSKAIEKIKVAATPPRFTQDFLNTKLKMKGGTANALIPFLKKIGLLTGDGTPTDLYHRYRNPSESGAAVAQALRAGYRSLYEVNEYAHDLTDEELNGLIMQVTGLEKKDRVARAIFGTFKALRDFADFDETDEVAGPEEAAANAGATIPAVPHPPAVRSGGINLSYTINLNLPPTTNIEVFNAIFKSLRQNLLKND